MESMTITAVQYVQDPDTNENYTIKATIDGVEMSVPMEPRNRHYAEIMRQVDAGTLIIQEP